jgi:hypothetical protein
VSSTHFFGNDSVCPKRGDSYICKILRRRDVDSGKITTCTDDSKKSHKTLTFSRVALLSIFDAFKAVLHSKMQPPHIVDVLGEPSRPTRTWLRKKESILMPMAAKKKGKKKAKRATKKKATKRRKKK